MLFVVNYIWQAVHYFTIMQRNRETIFKADYSDINNNELL